MLMTAHDQRPEGLRADEVRVQGAAVWGFLCYLVQLHSGWLSTSVASEYHRGCMPAAMECSSGVREGLTFRVTFAP